MKNRINIITVLCAAAFVLICILSACTDNTGPFYATGRPEPGEQTAAGEQTTGSFSGNGKNELPALEIETTEEQTTVIEQTTADEIIPVSIVITLATFNIKHGAEGLENVARVISEISPDIIGLEEVDINCDRSEKVDEAAELARLAGYTYYAFAKAISLGGGEYGTALLSRYPIESFEVIPLESGGKEKRSVGHAVVYIEEMKIDVLVTHLSYEDRSVRIAQMETIGEMLKSYDSYILVGDLNCFDLNDISYIGAAYYVNRPDRRYLTFHRYDTFIPDNIVVSDNFTELSSGMYVTECSDHNLLYAVFLLSEQSAYKPSV